MVNLHHCIHCRLRCLVNGFEVDTVEFADTADTVDIADVAAAAAAAGLGSNTPVVVAAALESFPE